VPRPESIGTTGRDGVPDRPAATLSRAKSTAEYDERGRAFRTHVWFDCRGQTVKVAPPGGLVAKSTFDGAGRVTAASTTDGGGDSSWADAFSVTGDVVLDIGLDPAVKQGK
jgi:hypothetical protein